MGVAAMLLSGCTAGASSEVREPAASAVAVPLDTAVVPTPTASPTPTVPTEGATPRAASTAFDASVPPRPPDALTGTPSQDAAGDVARYFLALYPYMRATGDFAGWEELSGESCDYCANARAMVTEERQGGVRGIGGMLEFGQVETFHSRGYEYAVGVHFVEHPSRHVASDGTVVEENPMTSHVVADLLVVWDEGWRVDSVVVDLLGQS